MSESEERRRLAEVFAAFVEMSGDTENLQLRGPHMRGATSPPMLGVSVRLQPDEDGPGVEMFVHPLGAQLSAWTARRIGRREEAPLDVPLDVDLRGAYRWGERRYADAAELSRGLLRRMEEEIRELPQQTSHRAAMPVPPSGEG